MGTKKSSVQGRTTLYDVSTWNHQLWVLHRNVSEPQMKIGSPEREEEERVVQGKGREGVCQGSFGTDTLQCKRTESSREHSWPLRDG